MEQRTLIVPHKSCFRHPLVVINIGIMKISVKKDDREGKSKDGIGTIKGALVSVNVSLSEFFQHSINLLGFSWEPESSEKVTECILSIDSLK